MKKCSKYVNSPEFKDECDNFHKLVGKRVRAWRKSCKITHFQFVKDICKYSQGTISKKECGNHDKFSLTDIYRICKVYGLPYDYFFYDYIYGGPKENNGKNG